MLAGVSIALLVDFALGLTKLTMSVLLETDLSVARFVILVFFSGMMVVSFPCGAEVTAALVARFSFKLARAILSVFLADLIDVEGKLNAW